MRQTTYSPFHGDRLAFHVFTPALVHRLDPKSALDLPVMALRFEHENFEQMMLFDRIECLGASSLDPLFDSPLPGTGGRGVAIMFTYGPVRCSWRGRSVPKIDCNDSRTPKDILADVLSAYASCAFHRTLKEAA